MNSLLEKCNKLGLKMTEQRRVITQVLSDSKDHPDVELVYKRASKSIKILGLLLYTELLNFLRKIILLKNMNLKMEDLDAEEVPAEHHDHLIDIKNGKVIEFQNDTIEELQKNCKRAWI